MIKEYHVAPDGSNGNPGTEDRPFKTISRAADIAGPGDTVTVHAGTYREWINPKRGGESDANRITYQAAPGEEVIIKGSEIIEDWEPTSGTVWKTVIPNSFFSSYNPYTELVRGDWLRPDGRTCHTGEVYINGRSLFEAETLDKVKDPVPYERAYDKEWSVYCWYCETGKTDTVIYANFQDMDPGEHLVEINVRPFVFWPDATGRNYITVRGFIMRQAATNWAPPTAFQTGLIGPHWSKGWIIEHNEISDSKCSGISLGKEASTGHNEWSEQKIKHGTQREREVVFRALRIGWSKENIGSHIIRNNVIHSCEQTGICGHLGAVFSEIYDNHIYNIHTKRLFNGAEIAGIKLHAPIDTVIRSNRIHNTDRGIWNDWQTQGTRISANLLWDNNLEDLFIEISHGPFLVDNNILLSRCSLRDASQGGAYVHNLFHGHIWQYPIYNRFTQYHFPHSTRVAGLMTILGGDNRFYNNIFVQRSGQDNKAGLHVYNEYPDNQTDLFAELDTEKWIGKDTKPFYAEFKLPMFCESNLFLNGALPWKHEKNAAVHTEVNPEINLAADNNQAYLHITADKSFTDVETKTVTTELLGAAFESEAAFEAADGSPYSINTDFFGKKRKGKHPLPGPFAELKAGKQKIRL